MRTITAIDRRGYDKGKSVSVNCPDGSILVKVSVGIYGWSATLAKPSGVRVEYHDGKPHRVTRFGAVIWDHLRVWGLRGRLARQSDYQAQKAYFEHVLGQQIS